LGLQRKHHDCCEPGETHVGKVYKEAWSTSNQDEKAVAQKKNKTKLIVRAVSA
jgi:hypothetical protein